MVHRPNPPSSLRINGVAETPDMATKVTDGTVTASAVLTDPDGGSIRLQVRYTSDKKWASYRSTYSEFVTSGDRAGITMTGLDRNTKYYVRAYARDRGGNFSDTYNSTSFWTDRYPNGPILNTPAENSVIGPNVANTFDWTPSDPDPNDTASTGWTVQYRVASSPNAPAQPWTTAQRVPVSGSSWVMPAGRLKASTAYEWRVRTRDPAGLWGPYSLIRSFTTVGVTKAPTLVAPGSDVAVYTDEDKEFEWRFHDPLTTATQGNADIRYRVIGEPTWTTVFGAALVDEQWVFPAGTFTPGYHYEWQVETWRNSGLEPLSDWSTSATFWTMLSPGSLAEPIELDTVAPQPALGVGTHRVHIFDQGGINHRGEITKFSKVVWGRERDEISTAEVTIDEYDDKTAALLAELTSWRYEVVIYRGEDRVWEGPITHLTDKPGQFIIGAKDVMAYVYRRILRQGYNDSYHVQRGVQRGLHTVVERAAMITTNALVYSDPNILPYLTLIETGADARQSRIVPDFSKTAWEEIDDLAANAGLDYTTVGRRIIYWDTHASIGVLPEMRDGDFSERPTVTEYGMNLANFFAVTDGAGLYGTAWPAGKTLTDWDDYYSPIEMLASAYGNETATPAVVTAANIASLQATLAQQARRSINQRYPSPRVARIPDNATLMPTVNVGINQLVPGVWIPLCVEKAVRPFKQMQKLSSITVTEEAGVETIAVVMSPAPTSVLDDPDSEPGDDEGDL